MSLGFLFFLPATGGAYRPDGDLVAHAQKIHEGLGDDMSATTDPASFYSTPGDPHPGRPAPRVVSELSAWVNDHCDLGSAGDEESEERFLGVSEFPVEPVQDTLHFGVPYSLADDTGAHLQAKAADLGLCMIDDMEMLWVNSTGVDRGLRMRSSVGTVTTHVDEESIRSALADDADRRERSDDGIPYVVIDTGLPQKPSPLDGTPLGQVRFVQAALLGNGWVTEYRSKRTHFRRHPGGIEEAVADLAAFADGDEGFLSRGWEDVTAETVRR
ncbi:MAG TPA: hypothetical protein H9870_04695 [Candidatus Corynebacterium avicola]|uniref:Uncharacterized protein n=1 Tax=Candidatus Corynebacterium avicola TaxID=2838527 RepID=A0A9D1UK72_9CORY|nr:hypothetical protein [Candidatus Corynebacterium avicola]